MSFMCIFQCHNTPNFCGIFYTRPMIEKKECPNCHGYGEVMYRERLIESDGSEDIGATPEVRCCTRCDGKGSI